MDLRNFINEWEAKYDQIENDEQEYKEIINLVSCNIKNSGSIDQEVFYRIIKWKSNRAIGKIQFDSYEEKYLPVIKECIREKFIERKIELLDKLEGIGVPIASTILHFIDPDTFPIIDMRTVRALNTLGYNISSSKKISSYLKYYSVIHNLKNYTKRSIREIDRALFSFDKITNKECEKKLEERNNMNKVDRKDKEQCIEIKHQILDELADKYIDDQKQREIFKHPGVWKKVKLNYLAGCILKARGVYDFSPLMIRKVICELIPPLLNLEDDALSGIVLTQDVHLQAPKEYNNGYPCLKKVGRGKYEFVGFINDV